MDIFIVSKKIKFDLDMIKSTAIWSTTRLILDTSFYYLLINKQQTVAELF